MVHVIKDVRHEGDTVAADVAAIVRHLAAITGRRQDVLAAGRNRQPDDLQCCYRCGCLCLPDEHCPGCMAARAEKEAV